jgi:polysaccharide export outer membrane protein
LTFQPSAGDQASAAVTTGSHSGVGPTEVGAATLNPNSISIPDPVQTAAAAEDYRIGPLDVLDISVFGVPELSGPLTVSASGMITMPLIGSVAAAGKSLDQFRADLTHVLSQNYLQSPQVTVAVKEAISQQVTVGGAVSKPGIYPTSGRTTLLQVMAMAGGLDQMADPQGILVFRQIDGKREVAKFDYAAISRGSTTDPVVAGGDVVMVDQSGFKTSMGFLRDSLGAFDLFAPLAPLL